MRLHHSVFSPMICCITITFLCHIKLKSSLHVNRSTSPEIVIRKSISVSIIPVKQEPSTHGRKYVWRYSRYKRSQQLHQSTIAIHNRIAISKSQIKPTLNRLQLFQTPEDGCSRWSWKNRENWSHRKKCWNCMKI